MNADQARTALLAQHARIRGHLEHCVSLGAQLRTGANVGAELDLALTQLREELAAHNESETNIIGTLLRGPAHWGSLMIDRMLEEHIAEHAVFWDLLTGGRDEVAARMLDLAEELDAHMAAEERTFLSPMTMRDDVIAARTRVPR
jgi:hypothetical protein